jgi:hypothetical protein
VARIIPVPGTCSKCWLHFAQQDEAADAQKNERLVIIHKFITPSVGSGVESAGRSGLFKQGKATDCVVP